MLVKSGTHCCSRSKVDIVSFDPENDDRNVLSQIRNLFVDGMTINNAPAIYINNSLQSDLKDSQSIRTTYLSGRGTFLLLSERDNEDKNAARIPSCDSCGSENEGNSSKRQRSIKGIVGLQDISSTTGTGGKEASPQDNANTKHAERMSENSNLCELRRMSVHSSSRRIGYGKKLVQACISHAKRSKFDGIKLYTGGWMKAAIQFYIDMEFEDRGRLEYKHDDGSVSIIAHLEMIF